MCNTISRFLLSLTTNGRERKRTVTKTENVVHQQRTGDIAVAAVNDLEQMIRKQKINRSILQKTMERPNKATHPLKTLINLSGRMEGEAQEMTSAKTRKRISCWVRDVMQEEIEVLHIMNRQRLTDQFYSHV